MITIQRKQLALSEMKEDINGSYSDKKIAKMLYEAIKFKIFPEVFSKFQDDDLSDKKFDDICNSILYLTKEFFDVSHDYDAKLDKVNDIWHHQNYSLLDSNSSNRAFHIADKQRLLMLGSRYLREPEVRCRYFDWLYLDIVIFQELDAFTYHYIQGKGLAYSLAVDSAKGNIANFYLLLLLYRGIVIFMSFLLPPLLAIFLSSKGYEIIANGIWILWIIGIAGKVISIPFILRRNRVLNNAHEKLLDLYNALGDATISTEVFSQRLKVADENKVGLDGSVYALAEILRKESSFI
jgi:hypothetical protein